MQWALQLGTETGIQYILTVKQTCDGACVINGHFMFLAVSLGGEDVK